MPRVENQITRNGLKAAKHAGERPDLRDAAEMHRRIYQAIRAHDPLAAREAMQAHLIQASAYQAQEGSDPETPRRPAAARGHGKRKRASG